MQDDVLSVSHFHNNSGVPWSNSNVFPSASSYKLHTVGVYTIV